MNRFFSKLIDKLYVKQWQIGICTGNIKDIIKSKTFNPHINWLPLDSLDYFHADPFILRSVDGNINIFFESFNFDDYYGKISLMKVDENFKQITSKVLLDTKSHLSYPFLFVEDNKTYMFPEAGHSGRLSCYEYDRENETVKFLKVIIDLPLLDSTVLKYNNKYWLFATMTGKDSNSKLYIYFSDNLLGPYTPHPCNPVKNAANGSRPAGDFIVIDGVIYRPSQNCANQYGESITINKVLVLDEQHFAEEPYMEICMNESNYLSDKILTVHTLNIIGDIIVVDGVRSTYSPKNQWKNFIRNRATSLQGKYLKNTNNV
jgi:hypothetical protein